ncbi:MAG: T9SS type A sorting domain-containing protein [Candidatus Hatepunaea meridiana]|nr:T9SS type A sorting domain-containing protein [Candidatus Hatepunaea meridiana]
MAAVFNVPEDYQTIQEGILATYYDGDTVLVAPGIYVENIAFAGRNVVVASYLLTTGDIAYIDSTIIDGDRRDCVVSFAGHEDERAMLKGFTIRNGLQDFGGGIDCQASVSPRIEDLIVNGNESNYIGGGIYCTWNSTPTITRCIISHNISDEGGGFGSAHEAHPILNEVVIYRNRGRLGGGIFAGHGNGEVTVENSYITNNSAEYGGGIYLISSLNNRFINVTIAGNTSYAEEGATVGGIHLYDEIYGYSEAALVNCILWNNTSPQIRVYNNANGESSQLWAAFCNIEGGRDGIVSNGSVEINWRDGNINANPIFVNLWGGRYPIGEGSPCIDNGTAFFALDDGVLLDLSEDEYAGEAPDIGAFEIDFDAVWQSIPYIANSCLMLRSYPNPFNNRTIISFNLPTTDLVSLDILDISGREVTNLIDNQFTTGRKIVIWNGDYESAGIYFARLSSGKQQNMIKLNLVR